MRTMSRRMLGWAVAATALLASGLALTLPSGSVARTAHAAAAQPAPSIFGLNTGTYDPSHARFLKDLPMAKHLGARWVAFTGDSIKWTKSGQPITGTLDYEVSKARKLGLGVLLSLGGFPTACSVKPRPSDPNNCPPTSAADLRNYAKILRLALLRYGPEIQYWESWVEPNHRASWAPSPDPVAYAALLKVQYAVFQSVNQDKGWDLKLLFGSPNDFSIIPGSPGGVAALPFTDEVLKALNGAKVFDGIALHAYRFPPAKTGPSVADYDSIDGIPAAPGANGPFPAEGCNSPNAKWCQMTWPQELSAYEQEFMNHGYGQEPLWVTQFGWPGAAHANGDYYPDEATQAGFLQEAYNDLLQLPFVQAALWFNLRNYKAGYKNPDPTFFANYGLLENNFRLKPAGKLFKLLAEKYPGR
jgi:hypothetical protein